MVTEPNALENNHPSGDVRSSRCGSSRSRRSPCVLLRPGRVGERVVGQRFLPACRRTSPVPQLPRPESHPQQPPQNGSPSRFRGRLHGRAFAVADGSRVAADHEPGLSNALVASARNLMKARRRCSVRSGKRWLCGVVVLVVVSLRRRSGPKRQNRPLDGSNRRRAHGRAEPGTELTSHQDPLQAQPADRRARVHALYSELILLRDPSRTNEAVCSPCAPAPQAGEAVLGLRMMLQAVRTDSASTRWKAKCLNCTTGDGFPAREGGSRCPAHAADCCSYCQDEQELT